jgi:hypothetical protein
LAEEKKRGGKSETLTIRLDSRTRFIVELVSRVRGQTITTVVERALAEAALNLNIANRRGAPATWQDFWDACEGIRDLKLAASPGVFPTEEEERLLEFVRTHWPFFYTSSKCDEFVRHYIHVLWPRINEFMETWEASRMHNYFAVGKDMQRALEHAKLQPPEWPQNFPNT